MSENIRTHLGDDGILLATVDMPGRRMNVFSDDLMNALEALLERVEQDQRVQAAVITSGKPAFLAGADLDMISMFADRALDGERAALIKLYGRLSGLFRRLEKSRKPYVAAVNGLALGGGLELAMACHERVVVEDDSAVLGLPEIKLGLLPGAGGTQRLPALVGAEAGLQMLLDGEPVTPRKARDLGLADVLVPANQLLQKARQVAARLIRKGVPGDPPRPADAGSFDFDAADVAQQIAAKTGVSKEQLADYPAYRAIIDCVAGGWKRDWDAAFAHEVEVFTTLMSATPVAGNMVRSLFLNLQRAGKQVSRLNAQALAIDSNLPEKMQARLGRHEQQVSLQAATAADVAVLAPQTVYAGQATVLRVVTLPAETAAGEPADASLFVPPRSADGQCVEIHMPVKDKTVVDAALAVAGLLRATPLLTCGPEPLLPALQQVSSATGDHARADRMLAVALAAARCREAGTDMDPALADVATIVAGYMPAFSGGAFTHLKQLDEAELRTRAERLSAGEAGECFRLPAAFDSAPASVSTA